MELRLNTAVTTLMAMTATLVVAVGIWATAFDGWRTDVLRELLLEPGVDKVAHVILYGAVALMFGLGAERVSARSAWIVGPSLAWTVGVIDELRQAGVRGRDASVEDLVANGVGIAIVAAILFLRRDRARS